MPLKTMSLITLLGSIITGPVIATEPGQAIERYVDCRGARSERHLERRG